MLNIILCSYAFHPSIGGIETVSRLLAEEFTAAGARVSVITESLGESSYSYQVLRRPSRARLLSLGRKADIILQSNISLNTLIPLLLLRKPIVITHHTWLTRSDGRLGWQGKLKKRILPFCHNLAISEAVSSTLPVPSPVIGNPFENHIFSQYAGILKDRDVAFMGRLVSDKGCDLLLQALEILKRQGIVLRASIIGDGAERENLECLVQELGISSQIRFLGALREGRAQEVARHKILVVPSRWVEPFGLVALEGIAAGCVIVASSQGGLPEAVGQCGVLFPSGDVKGLAEAIKCVYSDDARRETMVARGYQHIREFHPRVVADRYLKLFESLVREPLQQRETV